MRPLNGIVEMNPGTLSVVVPTLNERKTLAGCLDSVGEGEGLEIVVSDGGSRDDTLEIARCRRGVRIVEGPSGRGPQLNRGAAEASGEILLFLHADCRLPADWRSMVETTLADEATTLACFRLHTEPTQASGPVSRAWLRLFDLRSKGLGLPYGDQGFALRREVFDAIGGFPDIPLMEDVEVARACRRRGNIRRLPAEIRTAARRVHGRPVRTLVMLATFPSLFRMGLSPHRLARWYGTIR